MRVTAIGLSLVFLTLGGCMIPRPVSTGSAHCLVSADQPASGSTLFISFRRPECPGNSALLMTYFRSERPQFGAELNKQIQLLDEASWRKALADQVKAAKQDPILYIHGFNNSNQEALDRAALIHRIIHSSRPVIVLTWPSYGNITAYFWDEANAEWVFVQARQMIRSLVKDYPHLIIIAHSMGNRIALDAVADLRSAYGHVPLDRLIMASADVDRDTVRSAFSAAGGLGVPVTVYASREDQALTTSWRYHGYPRAGDMSWWVTGHTPAYVFTDAIGVDVVDTSNATHNRLRDPAFHDDFVDTPEGAADLCRVILGIPAGPARTHPDGAPQWYSALVNKPALMAPCDGEAAENGGRGKD